MKRLAAMMFLQYAVWGAWAPVLWPFLTSQLGLSQTQAGWIFSTLWLACIAAPIAGGQIADRWIPAQRVLGALHSFGGLVLFVVATRPERGAAAFAPWMGLMLIYSLAYAPTLAISNAVALRHLPDDAAFGRVRVFGTIGWIASGAILTLARNAFASDRGATCDALLLAGAFSIVLGGFSFFLPATPPEKKGDDPLAFRRAFVLLGDRNTRAFLLIAFVVTTELQFYYGPTASFLEQAIAVPRADVPLTMSVAQGAEIIAMAFVFPHALRRLGLAKTLAIGAIAWPLRYAVFALAPAGPLSIMRPLVVGSLALHGIGFTFFFIGSQLFIDRVAPKDIRSSAQSLLTLITLGVGNFLGTLFTGAVMERFTIGTGGAATTRWTPVFIVPCALTVLCAIAFLIFVREPSASRSS